ncbi:MAG: hypothetical protein ACR2KK_05515 [Acidimicrobiales bacterium]
MGPDVEVILVSDGTLTACPPWVVPLQVASGLMAELWAAGLVVATGPVVGVLSAGMTPERDWVARARQAAAGGAAAVGGAIEPGPGLSLVDWAVYFCRYTPYLGPLRHPATLEVPADNAVYRADVLFRYRPAWETAFWEPFVHKAMRGDGHILTMDADRVVRYGGGLRARAFLAQRFRHGRAYGELRSAGMSRGPLLKAVLSAPAVPFLMSARAGSQVYAKRRYRARFLTALPLVVAFYSSWAAGELVGHLATALRLSISDRTHPAATRR